MAKEKIVFGEGDKLKFEDLDGLKQELILESLSSVG